MKIILIILLVGFIFYLILVCEAKSIVMQFSVFNRRPVQFYLSIFVPGLDLDPRQNVSSTCY